MVADGTADKQPIGRAPDGAAAAAAARVRSYFLFSGTTTVVEAVPTWPALSLQAMSIR